MPPFRLPPNEQTVNVIQPDKIKVLIYQPAMSGLTVQRLGGEAGLGYMSLQMHTNSYACVKIKGKGQLKAEVKSEVCTYADTKKTSVIC